MQALEDFPRTKAKPGLTRPSSPPPDACSRPSRMTIEKSGRGRGYIAPPRHPSRSSGLPRRQQEASLVSLPPAALVDPAGPASGLQPAPVRSDGARGTIRVGRGRAEPASRMPRRGSLPPRMEPRHTRAADRPVDLQRLARWMRDTAAWVETGSVGRPPTINIYPVILAGTYDEQQWNVLQGRWRLLRAQLHGEVLPRHAADTPEDRAVIRIRSAAPRFSPASGNRQNTNQFQLGQ